MAFLIKKDNQRYATSKKLTHKYIWQAKKYKPLIYTVLKLNIDRRAKTKKADISVNLFTNVARRGIEPLLPE